MSQSQAGAEPPHSLPPAPQCDALSRFSPADVLVLLMTDVLIFLQEKDQKFTFPALVRARS